MKHIYRFLASREKNLDSQNSFYWKIMGDEWHHLAKVLHLQEKDIVEVFDGCGNYAKGSLVEISSKKFALLEMLVILIELPLIHLVVLVLSENIEEVC